MKKQKSTKNSFSHFFNGTKHRDYTKLESFQKIET